MSWTFTRGANAVALPDPVKGYAPTEVKAQAMARTAAGGVRVYDKDLSVYRISPAWDDLSDTEKTNLTAFFHNAPAGSPAGVDGMANTFTLTDNDAATYTARFVEPELKFESIVNGRWRLTVQLETSAIVTA